MQQWESNIRKFYYFKFFTIFNIINPILIFYMLEKGMTMGDILFLSAIQRVFGVIIEVPTGVLSDIKGHKYNLMLGTLSFSVSCILFSVASNFMGFLIAEIFIALAAAFISGADTAFVYESLEMYNAEDQYEKVFGKMRSIQFVVTAIVTLIAGFLAEISWGLPFYVAAAFSLVAFYISCTLVEPIKQFRTTDGVNRERYRQYYKTLRDAVSISMRNIEIRWFLLYTSLLSLGLITAEDYYQPYLKDGLGSPVMITGVIYTFLFLISAFFSNYTSYGIKKLGYGRMFYLIPGMILTTIIGMIFFKHELIIILFVLPYIAAGYIPTLISGYLNRRTNPGQRATILSLRQLVRKLVYVIGAPVIGYINDYWTMDVALAATAVILGVTIFLPLIFKRIYHLNYEVPGTVTQTLK